MKTHVTMVQHAGLYHKEDTLASAQKAGREPIVKTTSMTVWNSHVSLEPTVLILSMTLVALVQEDSLVRDVS